MLLIMSARWRTDRDIAAMASVIPVPAIWPVNGARCAGCFIRHGDLIVANNGKHSERETEYGEHGQ
jgi:hypothetical protein